MVLWKNGRVRREEGLGGGAVCIRKGKSDVRFEGVEGINFWGKSIPGIGHSWCKSPKGE